MKANPNEKDVQTFLSHFNTVVSKAIKWWIGGGAQEVHVDTLPTYTTKHFDQRMSMESVDGNSAMAEENTDLLDEANTQLWGAIFCGLATGVLNKYLDG